MVRLTGGERSTAMIPACESGIDRAIED